MENFKKIRNKAERVKKFLALEAAAHGQMLKDFEYLIHHIENINGKEEVHHCYVYDHIANLFEHEHLVVKNGKAYINDKALSDGIFHVIIGLEKSQEVAWTNKEAEGAKIKPKGLKAGMSLKQKAKEW